MNLAGPYEQSVLAAADDDGNLSADQLARLMRQHEIELLEYLLSSDAPEDPYAAASALGWLGY